jgi:hypothetical protein
MRSVLLTVLAVGLEIGPSLPVAADPCIAAIGCMRTRCRRCGFSSTTGLLTCLQRPLGFDGACGCTIQGNPPYACGENGECFYSDEPCLKVSNPNPGCRWWPQAPPAQTAASRPVVPLSRAGQRLTFPLS